MKLKATVEEAATAVAEGEFEAEVTGAQDMDNTHGPTVRIDCLLHTGDELDKRRVPWLASEKLSEDTTLGAGPPPSSATSPHSARKS